MGLSFSTHNPLKDDGLYILRNLPAPVSLALVGIEDSGCSPLLEHLALRHSSSRNPLPIDIIQPCLGFHLERHHLPKPSHTTRQLFPSSINPPPTRPIIDPTANSTSFVIYDQERCTALARTLATTSSLTILSHQPSGGARHPGLRKLETTALALGGQDGIIFVIDISDRDRYVDAESELKCTILDKCPPQTPLLVLVNRNTGGKPAGYSLPPGPEFDEPRGPPRDVLERLTRLLSAGDGEKGGREWVCIIPWLRAERCHRRTPRPRHPLPTDQQLIITTRPSTVSTPEPT